MSGEVIKMVSKVIFLAFLCACVSAGPLDGLTNVIEGFYETYVEQPFNSASCLTESLQSDLILEAEALAEDFIDEHSFALAFAHAMALYSDVEQAITGCDLQRVINYVSTFIAKEGWNTFIGTIVQNETILEGVLMQTAQDALVHDWDAVGSDLGTLLAIVVPPMIN